MPRLVAAGELAPANRAVQGRAPLRKLLDRVWRGYSCKRSGHRWPSWSTRCRIWRAPSESSLAAPGHRRPWRRRQRSRDESAHSSAARHDTAVHECLPARPGRARRAVQPRSQIVTINLFAVDGKDRDVSTASVVSLRPRVAWGRLRHALGPPAGRQARFRPGVRRIAPAVLLRAAADRGSSPHWHRAGSRSCRDLAGLRSRTRKRQHLPRHLATDHDPCRPAGPFRGRVSPDHVRLNPDRRGPSWRTGRGGRHPRGGSVRHARTRAVGVADAHVPDPCAGHTASSSFLGLRHEPPPTFPPPMG